MSSQSGFGILQVMVTAGIVGGLGYYVMQSRSQTNKVDKSSEVNSQSHELTSMIFRVLSHPTACGHSFNGMNATSTTGIGVIRDHTNQAVFNLTNRFGIPQIGIVGISLVDEPGSGDEVQVAPGGEGTTSLILQYREVKGNSYDGNVIRRRIKLAVFTDPSSRVTRCYSIPIARDTMWKTSGNNIFYDEGRVGFGLNSPQTNLHVAGSLQLNHESGTNFTVSGDGSTYHLRANSNINVRLNNPAAGRNADVQVGGLRSTEHIQILPSTAPCNASTAGSLRYSAVHNRLQLCGGNYWMSFAP